MLTKEIKVQRFSLTSSKGFHDIIAAIEAAVGHPDMGSFAKNLGAAKTFPEVEKIVREATGPSELMEFMRMDLCHVVRRRIGTEARRNLHFIVGNPVIMSKMA